MTLFFKSTPLPIRWGTAQGPRGGGRGQRTTFSGPTGPGPPCHPRTPPKAAQPKAQSPQPVKKRVVGGSTTFNGAYTTRQGQERGFALREMCGASMRLMRMSHRRAHWAPAWGRRAHWTPAGGIFGPLLRQTDVAGPLSRQTNGVTHVLDTRSTS